MKTKQKEELINFLNHLVLKLNSDSIEFIDRELSISTPVCEDDDPESGYFGIAKLKHTGDVFINMSVHYLDHSKL